ncbi:hypothetical protein ACOMHN_014359 [Nucella lapillus]
MPLDLPPTTQPPMRTSSLRTLPPPDAAPSQQQQIVTLANVRCGPRAINEYVDSPRPLPILPLKASHLGLSSSLPPSPTPAGPGSPHSLSLPCRTSQPTSSSSGGGGGGGGPVSSGGGIGGGGGAVVVSVQPSKAPPPPPLKEEGTNGNGGAAGGGVGGERGAPGECGKCRCAACAEPRDLPTRWCCGDRYEVSARRVLDLATCFCCVQTAFYHCGAEEDNSCYDNPCACRGSKCCSRWTCLAGAALLLPCLWCYWPLRASLAASTSCYNCCRRNKGCQCSKRPPDKTAAHSQRRRLLIESDSSSA